MIVGALLCRRNRHRLTWLPEVPPGRVIHGNGIPLRSYIVEADEASAQRITTASGSVRIAQQDPVCARCGTSLPTFQARRRLLGWSL